MHYAFIKEGSIQKTNEERQKMSKKPKPFNFKKPPRNPSIFWEFIARTLSLSNLKKRGFTYETHNIEGLKAPYILLSNHSSMVDFKAVRKIVYPDRVNNVASIETFPLHTEYLFRRLGVLGKRKFTKDLSLIRNIKYSLDKLGNVFCLYPEARYSFDGTTSYIPDSLGKMLKLFKVPVVVLILKGNFLTCPQWNHKEKNTHVEGDFTQIITAEELDYLSVDEINARIKEAFVYDDFAWQKENNIIIDDKDRAKGLHSLLYQCPHCKTEFKMNSDGTELWCEECGKRWKMTELGELEALSGETEFSHIPDWFKWERENVRNEVRQGTYHVEDDVRIDTLPNVNRFIKQGNGHFSHDVNGMTLTGNAYGEPFTLKKEPLEQESIHIEYGFRKIGDAFDLCVSDESYWFYPLNLRDILTKVSLATEEIYFYHREKLHNEI